MALLISTFREESKSFSLIASEFASFYKDYMTKIKVLC